MEPRDEEAGAFSPEQLRFTAAISKAMSKELTPLLAGRDLAQTRPNMYRGSKDGSIDGWILIMQRYLKKKLKQRSRPRTELGASLVTPRVKLATTSSTKPNLNVIPPRRCSSSCPAASALEGIACKCGKPSKAVSSRKRRTGCSIWTL